MTRHRPLFSIIIPTLNEEKYLPRLLRTIAAQSLKENIVDVHIADGGSRDATLKNACSFVSKLPIHTHSHKKGNVAAQRNSGAQLAKGEYLLFVDADTQLRPDFLHELKNIIDTHPHGIYIPYFGPDDHSILLRMSYIFMNKVVCLSKHLPRPLSSIGCVGIEKALFDAVDGYDTSIYIGEDHNLVRRARAAGGAVVCASKAVSVFSLRRLRREGVLRSLLILFFGIGYALIRGDIRKKYFSYEMGGHNYRDIKK